MSQPSRNKPLTTCLIIAAVIAVIGFCCLVITGGIGYFLYRNGQFSINQILSFSSVGPSEIQVINLSDGPIEVKLERISEDSEENISKGALDLSPYDISSFHELSSGEYILQINVPNGLPPDSTCKLNIERGQIYRVVTIPEGTVIALDSNEVDSIEELDISTSSLCQP